MKSNKSVSITPVADSQCHAATIAIDLPGDKSLTHRCIMLACISRGSFLLKEVSLGLDCLATMAVFRQLGCKLTLQGNDLVIQSPGWQKWSPQNLELDCQNSGTTARLLMGLFSGLENFIVVLDGDESLRSRPMSRITDFIDLAEGKYEYLAEKGYLPIKIIGSPLKNVEYHFSQASAQVKSAVMLSTLGGSKQQVRLPLGGRNHSELIMPKVGFAIDIETDQTHELIQVSYTQQDSWPKETLVPADPSALVFWLIILPSLKPKTKMVFSHVLLNPTRTAFFSVCAELGFEFDWQEPLENSIETVANLTVTYHNQKPSVSEQIWDGSLMIDEVPALASIALSTGKSIRFDKVEELRIKESDRLKKIRELVEIFGGLSQYKDGILTIASSREQTPKGVIDLGEDHRIVMCGVALTVAIKGSLTIQNGECASVSYPDFYRSLVKLQVANIDYQ